MTDLQDLGKLDRSSPEPLHKQLTQHLQGMIESGALPTNAKIPSERQLVEALGVSRITVRQAIKSIVQEGLVRSQPGKGFYVIAKRPSHEFHVLKSFTSTAIAKGSVPGSELIKVALEPVEADIAEQLNLSGTSNAFHLKRLRTLDGLAVSIHEDWMAPSYAPGLLDLEWNGPDASLYDKLNRIYGIQPRGGHTTFGARLATNEECALFGLEAPSAVLSLDQIAYDAHTHPVNVSRIVQVTSRYPISMHQSE